MTAGRIAALGCLILCCALSWAAWNLERSMQREVVVLNGDLGHLSVELAATDAAANKMLTDADETIGILNRDCGGGHPCGTLADVAKTLGTIRRTAGQIEVAAHHEDERIGVLDAQEAAIYRATHQSLTTLDGTLRTATVTIAGLQPVESGLVTTDSRLAELLTETKPILANAQGMTDSGNKILADAAYETHKLTHPDKKRLGFWGSIWVGIKVIHDLEPPIF